MLVCVFGGGGYIPFRGACSGRLAWGCRTKLNSWARLRRAAPSPPTSPVQPLGAFANPNRTCAAPTAAASGKYYDTPYWQEYTKYFSERRDIIYSSCCMSLPCASTAV